MSGIIVGLLWFLFWAIIGAGVVWLVLYGIKQFIWNTLPRKLEQGVWFLYLLLCVIFLIGVFAGGGGHYVPHPF